MLHETIRKDVLSATQRCNIVAALFRIVTTFFPHYNAALRLKSSLRIVSCNIAFSLMRIRSGRSHACAEETTMLSDRNPFFCKCYVLNCIMGRI